MSVRRTTRIHINIDTTSRVGSEAEGYVLHVGGFSGTAGDSLKFSNGAKFSTPDRDNDSHPSKHCAQYLSGAWWFSE